MKKLSLLFTLLAIACTSAFSQITKEQNIAEWTRAKAYTKVYLEAMPADGYAYKATPEVRTFAQQMLHLAGANYMFSSIAAGKTPPAEANVEKAVTPTKEAVTRAVLDSYDYVVSILQEIPAEQMSQEITLFKMKTTKGLAFSQSFRTPNSSQGTDYTLSAFERGYSAK